MTDGRLPCPHACGYSGQNEPALLAHLKNRHKAEEQRPEGNLPAPGPRSAAPFCRVYVRVSTDDQTNENQLMKIKMALGVRGWTEHKVYADKESGAKRNRAGLMHCLSDLRAGEVFVILRADRLSRSMQDFVEITTMVHKAGSEIWCVEQPVDTTSAMGRAFWQVLGIFAELERALILQRTADGHARARAQGKWMGRHRAGCGHEFTCPWGVDHSAAAVAARNAQRNRRPKSRPGMEGLA